MRVMMMGAASVVVAMWPTVDVQVEIIRVLKVTVVMDVVVVMRVVVMVVETVHSISRGVNLRFLEVDRGGTVASNMLVVTYGSV